MKQRMRYAWTLLVVLALLVTACGQVAAPATNTAANTSSTAAAKQPVEITFWHAMAGGTLKPTMEALIKQFNDTHPDIKVNATIYPDYNTLKLKTLAAIAAGTPPTLAQTYESWAAEYVKNGALVDLSTFINGKDGLSADQLNDFYKPLLDDGKLPDGKQWMMPFNKSDVVVYYNKDMLKEAGITTLPKTWDEFAADCKLLTKGSTQWCTTFVPANSASAGEGLWEAMVKEWGGSLLNDQQTKVAFNSPEAAASLQYLVDLYKKGYMKLSTGYGDQSDFGAKKIAFDVGTIAGYYYVGKAVGNKFPWGVAPLPAGPKGTFTPMFGTNLAIFAKATPEQQQAAWTFIKWLTSTDQAAYWAQHTGYMPISKSAAAKLADYFAKNPDQKVAADQLQYALPQPPLPSWPQIQTTLTNAIQESLAGKATPEKALADAAVKAQAILDGKTK